MGSPNILKEPLKELDGILTVADAPRGYWGELDKDLFAVLLRRVEEGSSFDQEVLHFFEYQERKDLYPYITDVFGRGAWHSLLSHQTERRIAVDVGAGLGAITEFLSGKYEKVYSIEACRERCQFLLQRKIKKGLHNVSVIHGCIRRLPFADGSVDLVACNGVLEWVGVEATGDVREAQLQFLREIHRVLRYGGVLYIGIENRVALSYFLGAVDHSGMKFTSLLPRKVADLFLSLKEKCNGNFTVETRSSGYRTYTYTKNGYEKLLREAGFISNEFFCVDPSYDLPLFAVPTKLGAEPARSFMSVFRPGMIDRLVPRALCSNYFIFVCKGDADPKVSHNPCYFGYYDTCTVAGDSIARESSSGMVRIEPLVRGKTILEVSRAGKHALNAPHIAECLFEFLRQPHAICGEEKHLDLRRILKETVGEIINGDDLDKMARKISCSHIGKTYHGDFWVGNIMKTDRGDLVAIDPEPQTFGSPDLDLVDFVVDFVINQRGKGWTIDLDTVLEYISKGEALDELFRLSLVRQVIRYSPFHRSNILVYRYRDLLRDFERSQGDSLMELLPK